MEEYVLRGNSAILKCHIPSFVSEYVTVNSWIISEDSGDVEIKLDSTHNYDGMKASIYVSIAKWDATDVMPNSMNIQFYSVSFSSRTGFFHNTSFNSCRSF